MYAEYFCTVYMDVCTTELCCGGIVFQPDIKHFRINNFMFKLLHIFIYIH